MVWRPGASSDPDSADQPAPWRSAVPPGGVTPEAQVVVEKWDDEISHPSRADEVAAAVRGFPVRPAVKRVFNLLVFAGSVVGALAGIGVAWMHIAGDPLADAHAYYEAASRLNAGEALYPPGVDPNGNHIYLYPPLFAMALRPLALLPYEWFALAWELIVVGSFVALVRYLGVRRRATWLAIGLLGVPIAWALTVAQAHLPFTWLLALGQPWSIAVAANLKLTPVLIAIWWLGRRDWESFFAFLVWGVLLVAVQVILEPNGTFAYFQSVGFEEIGRVRNLSPYVQSPILWAVLVGVGALVTLALARTRWGWPAVIAFVTFAPPRLLVYMLTGLLAALREPKQAGVPDPDDLSDPAAAYTRSIA